MSDFIDEARSRVHTLLRMARTHDERTRARIIEYADATPEPPAMGRIGLHTRGCPQCLRTMWTQTDAQGPFWVCSSCGHVEGITVDCPHCLTPMKPPTAAYPNRWFCKTCPRAAATGDSAEIIERHEQERLEAIRLLDIAIAENAHH